jgi:hypothetical protein
MISRFCPVGLPIPGHEPGQAGTDRIILDIMSVRIRVVPVREQVVPVPERALPDQCPFANRSSRSRMGTFISAGL